MEEKKARRNKRIVVISAMLVLLIAILCFGGATFAKYVTSKNAKVEQATVAKWGFVVTANADDLFHDAYNNDNSAVDTWTTPAANGVKVSADTKGNKIVAPGTSGSMTISISGTAEVAAQLTVTYDDTKTKDIKLEREASGSGDTAVAEIKYYPVKWTLKKDGTAIDAEVTGKSLSACLSKLASEFEDKKYAPNETISSAVYTLEWEWAFEDASVAKSDDYDTILGQIAAAEDADKAAAAQGCTYSTTIAFEFAIKIEQTETGK